MNCMVASSIPCKLSLCADRAHARAGDSHASTGIDFACPTTQSVLAIASPHELHGDSWPSSPTGTRSFCCNHQYSITAVTTSAGAIAERYAYSAYGQPTILDASASVLSSSAINNRYTYTGREWDATLGLQHFRARWMSPSAGRFLGRDSIGYRDSFNLQQYVGQFVLSGMDPSGNLRQRKIKQNMNNIKDLEECGKYFLTFEWVLEEHEKQEGGIIIQLVTTTKNCKSCSSKGSVTQFNGCTGRGWKELDHPKYTPENKRQCSTYWEMWDVPKGGGGNQETPLQDIFADPGCVEESTGTSTKKGTAIFIPDSKLTIEVRSQLKKYFKTGPQGAAAAHSLPSVCYEDADFGRLTNLIDELGFPHVSRKTTEGWIEKSVTVRWNCCDKERLTQWGAGGGIEFTPKNSEAE